MSKVKLQDIDAHTKEKLRHGLRRKETYKVKKYRKDNRYRSNKFYIKDTLSMYKYDIIVVPEHTYYRDTVVWVYGPWPGGKQPIIRKELVTIPEHERKIHHYLGDKDIEPYIQERSRGSKKFLRKVANRKVRHAKERFNDDEIRPLTIKRADYKRLYDLWWEYY